MPSGRSIRCAPTAPALPIVVLLTVALLGGCGGADSGDASDGTKAPAPGVPLAKGGDNSIQTYGVEAPKADRARAAAVVEAYLGARANGRWQAACSYLNGLMRAKLERLAQYSKGKVVGCGGVMEAFASHTPAADLRSAADVKALSLRVRGHQGFLIYRDGKGFSDMPLNLRGGEWKIASLTGIPLALGET